MTPAPLPELEGVFAVGSDRAALSIDAPGQSSVAQDARGSAAVFGRVAFRDAELQALALRAGPADALLEGFTRRGARVLELVSGEYLVAAWSAEHRRGLAATDRFATYPLYFGAQDGRVAFAMRPDRVCALLSRTPDLDPRAVHAYLYFHVVPAPLSIYRGVARLDVGEALLFESGAHEVRRHWSPVFVEEARFEFERERDAFLAALRRGVGDAIGQDGRDTVGCFLSGGTDSSTIAGLATEAFGAPARTFAIAFDVSAYDESRYSRLASRHFGTEHTEHVLTPAEAAEAIDVLAAAYEQPFGNSSAVPTHVCARIAREAGVTRMLGGDGGDELYGGNERYATQWLLSLYGRVPGAARRGLLEPLLDGALSGTRVMPVRKLRGYVEQARVPLPDRLHARYGLLNRFGLRNVLADGLLDQLDEHAPLKLERAIWRRSGARTQINRLLEYDFKFTLGDNDLAKVTRMCNAAGVQVAFPMLADAVVDHALKLAPGEKLKRMRLRHFFKEALRGFLPDEIIDKPKHGFGMPFGDWLLAQPLLRDRADDALASLAHRGIVRKEFLGQLHVAMRSGHPGYYGTMVWVLMMLELWLRGSPVADVRLASPPPRAAAAVPASAES